MRDVWQTARQFHERRHEYRDELDSKKKQKIDENDFTLKPEGTARGACVYRKQGLADRRPSKIYSPQPVSVTNGLRQVGFAVHQFGIENLWPYEPSADAGSSPLHIFHQELGSTVLELPLNHRLSHMQAQLRQTCGVIVTSGQALRHLSERYTTIHANS